MEYDKSLATSEKVLAQALKTGNNVLIAKACNQIGLSLRENSDFNKSIQFYNKALHYADLTSNDILKNRINNNIGDLYISEKTDLDKGILYYKKALFIAKQIGDSIAIAHTQLDLTKAYFKKKDYTGGIHYLNSVNNFIINKGDFESKISSNFLYGTYYNHFNKIDLALASYEKAIEYGKFTKDERFIKNEIILSYKELSNIYKKKGDYKNALLFLKLRNDLSDRYNEQENLRKAKLIGTQIKNDDYKRQIYKIKFEKELQRRSLRKSKIVVGLFFAIFIIFILLLFTLFRNINFKKKTNDELLKVNADLKIAKEKAEEASLLKTQFVSTISHELRTPLYGIIGIANMLLDENKGRDNSHLNSLKFSARYLLSLVNDIFQINKIDDKHVILDRLTFNISEELDIVSNCLQYIANKNENSIFIDVDPAIPENLIGDKLRLSQILMNLVSNALKFTKNGEVNVSVHLKNVVDKLHYLEFQIRDNGVGIAKSDQDKIYDKFVQVGRKEEDYHGTGLGLSIVKRLIGLFNSEIHLASQINKGTTFRFTIAFEVDSIKTEEIINSIEVDMTTNNTIKVLVVEDNKINQIVTKKIIEKNNYKCDVVNDGLLAIKKLETETYDVILMDINMPIISGFETTRRIRKKGITTPIVALTAFVKEEIAEEAFSSGMNDIVSKPFEPIKLFQIINSQVYKTKA
ncbi:response regulator [Flavobacterium psychrotolerans]|uniref:response regulator n=1 Tax=Flavobacterium psychrotolerans TaxID=2169410 RepID=UPI001FB70DD8|nr:response regulator [Flavobacterium psychrotolerans]